MRPVSRVAMAAALTVSALSMLAHNLYELPLSPIDLENSGPIAFAAILGVAYALRPDSKVVAAAALGWGVLNLVIGGIVSVLPLLDPAVRARAVGHALRSARRVHARADPPGRARLPRPAGSRRCRTGRCRPCGDRPAMP